MSWVSVSKGDSLPQGAFLAGEWNADGVLYVGRSSDGEIGKYNVDSGCPGGNVHNLWTHSGGRYSSGKILVIPPGKEAVWQPYSKGRALPKGAFQAGHYPSDGVLFIGKCNGEIGKLNMSNGRTDGTMHNLWCHSQGRCSSGYILTIVTTVLDITATLIPIVTIRGGSKGFYDDETTITVGCSDIHYESSTFSTFKAQAEASINKASLSASASTEGEFKASFRSALSKTSQQRTEKKKIHVSLEKPCYVYQAQLSLPDGFSMHGDSLIFSEKPLGTSYSF